MKIKHFFLMVAIGLMATAMFTSCEDILGHWERPTYNTGGGGDDGGSSTPAVYTMAKDATDADKGKLICADGHIQFQESVNLFRKTTVNYIRKKSKNCQPKLGKDRQLGALGAAGALVFFRLMQPQYDASLTKEAMITVLKS